MLSTSQLFSFGFVLAASLPIVQSFADNPNPGANWPSFRGTHASGVIEGQDLPDRWDGQTGMNIKWKTRIPGLAHSSPIVWGDKIFVTTAVSGDPNASFRPGLYGDGDASKDVSVHQWRVLCLDRLSGKILWDKVAHEGVPQSKRHIKATYANCTPATDGKVVIAHFGSEGLFAFDFSGKLLWKKDLGDLDVGAYNDASYEWGPASSPIIYDDLVIVQCDMQKDSYLMACNVSTGETVWRTPRDELPSWGTPTVYVGKGRAELITNGSNFIRGYDPRTGKELWRLGGSSKITAPTPVYDDGLIIVASGRGPEKPIFAIRPGASGDITLGENEKSNSYVAWLKGGRGSYMPTPLIYDGQVYVCKNNGILGSYDLKTGKKIYNKRIAHQGGGFSASPVAADWKIYLPSEDGDIFVLKAGREFELIATNPMGELLMATPAIAGKMMFVRGQHHLFAIGK